MIPFPVCEPTRDLAVDSSTSHARQTNSIEKPVKMPLDPVRKKSVKDPGLWAVLVSPKKRTWSSVSSLLNHHVITPKGRAMVSPVLIARTFSSFSGRTMPATPLP